MLAVSQSPLLTRNIPAVIAAPRTVNKPSRRTRALPLSAMAPTSGATSATMKLAAPLAIPRRKVLSVAGTPAFQNCLKNCEKNPAMTVQANEELAQSYMAQPKTARRVRTRRACLVAAAVAMLVMSAAPVHGAPRSLRVLARLVE